MTALAVENLGSFDGMIRTWADLDLPEGWQAEIDDGGIVMMPPPAPAHNQIAGRIHRALLRGVPEEWDVYQTLGITIRQLETLYIPDLVVMPRTALAVEELTVPAEEARLAVEITSDRGADRDRKAKLRAYAHGPVPVYLLVDRHDEQGPHATVFSDPAQGRYRRVVRTPFSDPVALPDPVPTNIETSDFPSA